jgi:hypothetical protein
MPTADVQILKQGPNGRPAMEVYVDAKTPLDQLSTAVIKNVTRNADLLKKLGLRACPACISGLDILIRHRFDEVVKVNF